MFQVVERLKSIGSQKVLVFSDHKANVNRMQILLRKSNIENIHLK